MNISSITNAINSLFNSIDSMVTKVVPMPAILLLCACLNRKGLSVLRSLSNVCKDLEANGIPTHNNPDGSPNLIVKAVYATISEIYRAMTEDAVVQGAISSGDMTIVSNGANSAGPVVSSGTNILPTHLWGSIQ